jgi:hypothetical protein
MASQTQTQSSDDWANAEHILCQCEQAWTKVVELDDPALIAKVANEIEFYKYLSTESAHYFQDIITALKARSKFENVDTLFRGLIVANGWKQMEIVIRAIYFLVF